MDKHSTNRLLSAITTDLSEDDVQKIRLHVETLAERYHAGRRRISELEAELAYANFDRDCLVAEKHTLEEQLGLAEAAEDEALIAALIEKGIPPEQKIAAVKYVRAQTGWSLKDCKRWVEENFSE